jgi:hypothetical protein
VCHYGAGGVMKSNIALIGRRGFYAFVLFFPLAIISFPLFLYSAPSFLDFQNHLARLSLIMGSPQAISALKFYDINWRGMSTDIGLDLIALIARGFVDPITFSRAALNAAQYHNLP